MKEDFLWKRQRQRQRDTLVVEEEERQDTGLNERQEEEEEMKGVTEPAFLVTRTNQQALALAMVGSPYISFSNLLLSENPPSVQDLSHFRLASS